MATQALRERLARDLGGWLADGLISAETHALLARRYEARSFGLAQAVKYVGISGGVLAFFGLLGLVGAVSESLWVAAGLLCSVGVGVTVVGIRLSRDALGRYAVSSKMVLALGV